MTFSIITAVYWVGPVRSVGVLGNTVQPILNEDNVVGGAVARTRFDGIDVASIIQCEYKCSGRIGMRIWPSLSN